MPSAQGNVIDRGQVYYSYQLHTHGFEAKEQRVIRDVKITPRVTPMSVGWVFVSFAEVPALLDISVNAIFRDTCIVSLIPAHLRNRVGTPFLLHTIFPWHFPWHFACPWTRR